MKTEDKSKSEFKPFDVAALDTVSAANDGVEIEIFHHIQTSMSLGIFITVHGKESDVYQEHLKENINENTRQQAKYAQKDKTPPVKDFAELKEKGMELVVLCTIGWKSIVGYEDEKQTKPIFKDVIVFNGEELKFTVANAKKLYTALPEFYKQVDRAIADNENFTKALQEA